MTVQTATIETRIPARLDRLPWSRFHWLVIVGLGTVWILDGLEVTIVGSVASRLTESDSGISITAGQIGTAAAIYVIGACIGALFFGQLTDRFGRKKLFILTLGIYILATVATAFSFSPWYFFAARFFTGAGIGGEYAAINSAIDELIPARVRGRVDLLINGSYWLGSAAGSGAALFFLDKSIFPADIGWRIAFGIGAVLGLTIMLVRRHVPESPRWLFIHGQEEAAERIVSGVEHDVEEETGQQLDRPDKSITVRQRSVIPFRTIAHTAFKLYPKRSILGLALFVGQAFIYNGITFNLGTLFGTFYGVSSSFVPIFIIVYAVGNFLGPVLLGRLFDTVGRKPMITGAYLGSAIVTVPLALFFLSNQGGPWTFEAFVFATFFLASAGASAAYLTVSEIFPMETRALAIAFFYAIGTGIGGVAGPVLFGRLIGSGDRGLVTIAFFIGAAVMAVGGITEVFFGVKAEQAQLEGIAKPLTVEEAEQDEQGGGSGDADTAESGPAQDQHGEAATHPRRRSAVECREQAEGERARAAEHRATVHELRAAADAADQQAADRLAVEESLAEIAELRAAALDEKAAAHEALADADEATETAERNVARERAQAAEQRARGWTERAEAVAAEHDRDAEMHAALAEAAGERARAREQRALAATAQGEAAAADGGRAALATARGQLHERWAEMHDSRAQAWERRAADDRSGEQREREHADALEQLGLAAEERVRAAEHRAAAEEAHGEVAAADEGAARRAAAADHQRALAEAEERIRARIARRNERERSGLRRFRPGPGSTLAAPRMIGLGSDHGAENEALDHEIDVLARALLEHGPTQRQELARLVGARYWGPGRFRAALSEAVEEGRAQQLSRSTYAPAERDGDGA